MKSFAIVFRMVSAGVMLAVPAFLLAQPVEGPQDAKLVGTVVAVRGNVEAVSRTNVRRLLAIRNSIVEGDTVSTGPRGRIQISFTDETIIHLGRNTEMLIDEYEYSAEKSSGKMVTHVKSGVFRVMGGAITKIAPDSFRTVTPTATIGIRGSFYMGSVSDQLLKVVFLGGRGIWVRNEQGGEDIQKPGYGTSVHAGERPASQRRYNIQELTTLVDGLLAVGDEGDGGDDTPASGAEGRDDVPPIGDDDDDDDDLPAPTPQADDDQSPEEQVQKESTQGSQTRDTTPPVVTVDPQETRDTTPTFTGTVDDFEAAIVVTVNGVPYEATNNGDGTWELSGELIATALADGAYTVAVNATDRLGNSASVSSDSALKVTTAGLRWVGMVSGETEAGGISLDVHEVNDTPSRAAGDLLLHLAVEAATADPGGVYTGLQSSTGDHTFTVPGKELDVPFSYSYDDLGEFLVLTAGIEAYGYGDRDGGRGTAGDREQPPGPAENPDAYAMSGRYLSLLDDGEGYRFLELGFAGIPSYVLPTTGLAAYSGPVLTLEGLPDGRTFSFLSGGISASANFHSGKVMGRVVTDQGATGVVFVGDISGTGISNVVLLGGGVADTSETSAEGTPFALKSTDAFGQFYGSAHQGLGLYLEAAELSVRDGTKLGDLSLAGGLYLASELLEAPTGEAVWNGFAIGVSEDIDAPDQGPVLLFNSQAEQTSIGNSTGLRLDIDRDNGTVRGFMALTASGQDDGVVAFTVGAGADSTVATDADSTVATDADSTVATDADVRGDTSSTGSNSVYVSDKGFAAELALVESTRVVFTGAELNEVGNYMVTAPVEEQMSDWLTWGYWATASTTVDGEVRHVHMPGAYWVAGELTPRSYIRGLIGTTGAMGVYNGGARCVALQSGMGQQEMSGTSNLRILFDTRSVNGTFTFPDLTLGAAGVVDPGGNGFTGWITSVSAGNVGTGVTPTGSSLQGDFFGPQANAVGGSFSAEVTPPDSQVPPTQYIGTFAGDR